jgi:hypothetical protein
MANEIGIVAILKDIIPRGARIPVRTRTAAKGKKTTPKGTCRQSRPAIKAAFFHSGIASTECAFDETT